ncbi:MAG: pentapeptide repeat-containing protein [Akkermansiaceae bacterium]|nr:pentapeptide repeat-containing protein [Akkermansiaceae bacterium]
MPPEPPDERAALTDEIIALQEEYASLKAAEEKSRQRISRIAHISNRTLLYLFLGPRLTNRLGELIYVAKERREPIMGTSLAKVLDSASRKMTGYKRWAVMFGLIAAIPGVISMTLLWQQNIVVKRETDNSLADIQGRSRLDLLLTIYSSEDKDPESTLLTPSYPASLRTAAALKLIEMDTAAHRKIQAKAEAETPDYWRVDLARAPLAGVNFTPSDQNATQTLDRVSFMGSNFFNASFENCDVTDSWFDGALFIQTNFRNTRLTRCAFPGAFFTAVDFSSATFEKCDFKGAKYDRATTWPAGFDPVAAGAILTDLSQKGDTQ